MNINKIFNNYVKRLTLFLIIITVFIRPQILNSIYNLKIENSQIKIESNDYQLTTPWGVKSDNLGDDWGNRWSIFNFYVTYKDVENKTPQNVSVEVNGHNHTMWKKYDWDNDYTDGVIYEFNATADELGLDQLGSYDYCFYAFNGSVLYRLPIGFGYFHFKLVNAPPELYMVEEQLTPLVGFPTDTFVFRVNYTDIDNDTPGSVIVCIEGPRMYGGYMKQEDPNDKNYVDGVIFICEVTGLKPGRYQYYFVASDSELTTSLYKDSNQKFEGLVIFSFWLIMTVIVLIILTCIYGTILIYIIKKWKKARGFKNS